LFFRFSGFSSPSPASGGLLPDLSIYLRLVLSFLPTISHVSTGGSILIQSGSDLIEFGSYNLRQKDVSVVAVGFNRALAVTAGILWAALVSRFWWPAEARRELSKLLSEFSVALQLLRLEKVSC